jgi:ABC-type transport system involved in multi-copper enzyme maturation permease subunit
MGASFAAELLKLYKRPAAWVIAAIWLVFVVLLAYALPYALFANLPQPEPSEDIPAEMQSEMQAQNEAASEQLISQLYPEALVSYVLSNISSTGGTLALILGALVVGSEYGWGTLKTVLSQRPGRLTAFFAKMLALGAALVLFVLLAFVVGAICSLIVTGIQGATVDWPSLVELLEGLGASAVILAVWAALGVFLATLFRSTALAVGLGLFYALALEGLVFALPIPNESFQDARRFFLGQNSGFLADSFAGSSLQQPFVPPGPDVGAAQAALVLCLYLAAFLLIAALAFRQRDVT